MPWPIPDNDSLATLLSVQWRGLGILAICWLLLKLWPHSAAQQHNLAAAGLLALVLLPLSYQFFPPIEIVETLPQELSAASNTITEAAIVTSSTLLLGLGFYLAVALVLLARQLGQYLMLQWLNHRSHVLQSHNWQQALYDQAAYLGINRKVRLRHSYRIQSPMTLGVFRPIILLPSEARDWNEQLIHSTLLHELAHIQRNDWLVQQGARVICTLYWFNPLAWLLLNKITTAAEFAADAVVLEAGVEKTHYAEDLLQVARYLNHYQAAPAAQAMAANTSRSELYQRLSSILDKSQAPRGKPLLVVLLVFGLALPLLSLRTVTVWVEQRTLIGDFSLQQLQALVLGKPNTHTQVEPVSTAQHNNALADAHKALQQANQLAELATREYSASYRAATAMETISQPEIIASAPAAPNTTVEPVIQVQIPPAMELEPYQRLELVQPNYPRRALQRGIEGAVTVEFSINENGQAVSPVVVESTSGSIFNKPVLKAIQESRFIPTKIDGQPVMVEGARETFVFVMEG